MRIIPICIFGIAATIFETSKDKYSLCVGGFYNWHVPLDEALIKTKEVLRDIAARRFEKEFKALKKRAKLLSNF